MKPTSFGLPYDRPTHSIITIPPQTHRHDPRLPLYHGSLHPVQVVPSPEPHSTPGNDRGLINPRSQGVVQVPWVSGGQGSALGEPTLGGARAPSAQRFDRVHRSHICQNIQQRLTHAHGVGDRGLEKLLEAELQEFTP